MGTAPSQPRWGLGDAVGGFLVGLVLSSVVASAFLANQADRHDLSLGGQALAEIGLWTGLAGAVVLASRRKGTGRLSEDFGLRAKPVDLAIGMVAGVLAQLVLLPGIALLMRPLVGEPKNVSRPVEDLVNSAHGASLVGLFLFVVVGAPVVEELFFRGLVLRSLQRRMGTPWAVAISAVSFGVAHPQDLPPGALALVMVSLAALGAVLGVLAVRTGRLAPSIVAHAAFNAWTLVFLLAR